MRERRGKGGGEKMRQNIWRLAVSLSCFGLAIAIMLLWAALERGTP